MLKVCTAAVLVLLSHGASAQSGGLQPYGVDAGKGCRAINTMVEVDGKDYAVARLSCPSSRILGERSEDILKQSAARRWPCIRASDTPLSYSGSATRCHQGMLVCGYGKAPPSGLAEELPAVFPKKVSMPVCDVGTGTR